MFLDILYFCANDQELRTNTGTHELGVGGIILFSDENPQFDHFNTEL